MTSPEAIYERVLLTNDDGIDAPGMQVLEHVARSIAREVWVVAPLGDQSGTSNSISLHRPLRLSCLGERRMAVDGTPGDCVAMGLGYLLTHPLPDLILSGVNRGANLGNETVFSGTVGAAMTGLLFRVPSIALSQAFLDRSAVPWHIAKQHGAEVIRKISTMGWQKDTCLNVNFPISLRDAPLEVKVTHQGRGTLCEVRVVSKKDPGGQEYHWLQLHREAEADQEGTEASELDAGYVTVTPLCFDRTQNAALQQASDSALHTRKDSVAGSV